MGKLRSGDIKQFMFAGRELDIKGGAAINYWLPGYIIENGVTGNGKRDPKGTRRLGGIDNVPVSISNSKEDLEFLNSKNDGEDYPLNITMIDDTTYGGSMAIEGEITADTGEGKCDVSFRGDSFEKI